MKKLLLASIVMIGFTSLASAQALREAKKQAAAPQPTLMNANQQTAPAKATVARQKTDADNNKTATPAAAPVRKATPAAPAKKATKTS